MVFPPYNKNAPHEGFDSMTPVADVFSFADLPHIDHRVDASGRELLRIDETVPYPRGLNRGSPINELILSHVEKDPNMLRMPLDYVSLPHALNEAAGNPQGDKVVSYRMYLFGIQLARVARIMKSTPNAMDYSRIILERTEAGGSKPLFMPPVEFVPIPPRRSVGHVMGEVSRLFRSSLYTGASTLAQRTLATLAVESFSQGAKDYLDRPEA